MLILIGRIDIVIAVARCQLNQRMNDEAFIVHMYDSAKALTSAKGGNCLNTTRQIRLPSASMEETRLYLLGRDLLKTIGKVMLLD